jgi:tripartite-type tricarboxylate transporter receptor subunit TctC
MFTNQETCMEITRRTLLGALVGIALLTTASTAAAQAFPSRTITIIVPYAPGGSPDTLARMLAPKLSASLGQSVVVENKPGASGNIAASYVARSPADGYTLLLATQPMLTINPSLFKNMGYEPRDLTPITACANVVMALSVNPSVPATNMTELIAWLKQNPGTSYGTSGIGTPMHLAGLRLARMEHVELTHVAYRGGAMVLNDLLSNNIKVAMVDYASSKSFADSGKLRIIAIGEPKRFSGATQIPTIGETIPGFELTSWFGFFGPGGMPPAVVASWNAALGAALQDPELKEKLYALGIITRSDGPAELARLVRTESESFGREVRDNKISVE